MLNSNIAEAKLNKAGIKQMTAVVWRNSLIRIKITSLAAHLFPSDKLPEHHINK